ncbi:hypothetical protein AZI86_05235 [Bdellovibrio bacteriovorus]|uniref:Helicase/UvrB N-terminal domain-containing protein n=1 Tax=Bdellovibrio bacteriovorus TaxID=959 RepID=A0A150WPU7_BDEBC|nr:DEAD/DEAH box helicase family protein [Bdellovibrio bacteriovorus]KYG66450.1 hypothetical protein AZI86_05235 [Bdellovibrio bacteriovorus]
MGNTTRTLAQRMSLRKPQKESLEILERAFQVVDFKSKDSKEKKLDALLTNGGFGNLKEFDRDFPSLSFAIATGVGKTRLMGAFISYLFIEHKIRDFLILAPNLTIYNKLIDDFRNTSSPKYVFRGIGDFVHHEPRIITGDDYESVNTPRKQMFKPGQQQALFTEDLAINIFNISKLDKDVSKIKSINEYLGEAYFDYLKNLENLVVIMDESHRYRAERGMQVINDLNPILGLELTATPVVSKGGKDIPFKNIAYEYSLAKAIRDGFVKEPYAATRKNFDLKSLKKMDKDELDQMKLQDAVVIHEKTKTSLDIYSKNNGLPRVKPFILVVAEDTKHAEKLLDLVKSPKFFDGQYSEKVVTIHSGQKGSEKDEVVQGLLSVEKPENPVEIVIHVNILKEGWDVTNLFTIVPLRSAAAVILREQTLGRGLRLPYGQRTGDPNVDRLTVVAHELFKELIEAATDPNSIIMKEYIIDPDDPEFKHGQEIVTVPSLAEAGLQKVQEEIEKAKTPEAKKMAEVKYNLKKAIIDAVADGTAITDVKSLKELTEAKVKKELQKSVTETLPLMEMLTDDRDKIVAELLKDGLLEETLQEIISGTIEIPRIVIQPSGETKTGFHTFKLDTKPFPNWQPVDEEILIKALQSGETSSIGIIKNNANSRDTNVNTIVRQLINNDEVDYDEHKDLLYSLAETAIEHIEKSHKDPNKVSNVVQFYAKDIASQIWLQMSGKFFVKDAGYEASDVQPFQRIEKHNFSKIRSDNLVDFRTTFKSTGEMRLKILKGFKKSCHSYYKFDVKPERDFAVILEDDKNVEKWLRPAHNQFKIFYSNQSKMYEPDFVVQTEKVIYMVEIKDSAELQSDEVQDKARSATQYCNSVNEYLKANGGRTWKYLLIPHDQVETNKDIKFFQSFEYKSKDN